MTDRPPTKSLPAHVRRRIAEQPVPRRTVGGLKDVAEGVLLRSDPRPATGVRVVGVLHIVAPGRATVPTATSRCSCGRDRSAVGQRQVLALIDDHTAHRAMCPLLTSEGRDAA